jgi:hypothetical protein
MAAASRVTRSLRTARAIARARSTAVASAPADPRLRRRPPSSRRLLRPRQVAVVGLVGLGLALLCDASALERSAESSPYGLRRTVELSVLHPLSWVSSTLRLDRPKAALESAMGRRETTVGNSGGDVRIEAAPAPSAVKVDPTLVPVTGPPPEGTAAQIHRLRPSWTAQQPLRLWVGGDSVAGYLSIEMVNIASETGVINAHGHYKTSTGLSRPDYYDWPAHLAEDMAQFNPEVAVFMVGANDDQPLSAGNDVYDFGSPQWREEYGRRVGRVMDMLTAEGRLVFWVGQPVMHDAGFDSKMELENQIYRAQALQRAGVSYVDSRPLFSEAGGGYAPYLANESGELTLMRAPDGIHLTPAGGSRLALQVLRGIRDAWADDNLQDDTGLTPRLQ